MISIHALREEGDTSKPASAQICRIFLSTPSARRATAERLAKTAAEMISIHALREEGDTLPFAISPSDSRFLFTWL